MNPQMDQVDDLLRRPKAYYNVDGVGELGMGVMCLGFALLFWIQVHAPEHSYPHSVWFVLVCVWSMCLMIHFGSRAIKNRITYPRTGWVEYRRRDRLWVALVSAPGAAAVVAVARSPRDVSTVVLVMGTLLTGCYAYRFARTARWKWAVAGTMAIAFPVVAMFSGSAMGPLGFSNMAGGIFLVMLVCGPIWLVSGGISLYLYLRHTRDAQ